MRLAGTARLLLQSAIWRVTAWPSAGRALVRALAADDEGLRTIAGMLLVRAGPRAQPLLQEALGRRESLPMIAAILGDIGDPASEQPLSELSRDPDPEVARAAREALRVLDARRGSPASGG